MITHTWMTGKGYAYPRGHTRVTCPLAAKD
jgi:hypothetical protein